MAKRVVPTQKRMSDKPPVGYATWLEAAEDADADGMLEVLDAREQSFWIRIPEEYRRG